MSRRFSIGRLALVAAIVFVSWLVTRYDLCFQDGEMPAQYLANAVANGLAPSLSDIPAAFDTVKFDGDSRPRVLSYLSYILTVKTRLALWRVVPPHPSFSPIWLLSLGLAPWLLFRFLTIELGNRAAATAGVAVYLVSTGCLSGVVMLFHPAKPLANVLVIGVLCVSARLQRALTTPGAPSASSVHRLVAWLLVLLAIAPFVDESAAFAWVIPPFFCPAWFREAATGAARPAWSFRRGLVFLAPIAASVAIILFVMPWLTPRVTGGHFGMLDYFNRMARSGSGLAKLGPTHVVWQAGNLLIPETLPWSVAGIATPVSGPPDLPLKALLGLFLTIAAVTLAVRHARTHWSLYRKLFVLAAMFVGFQTLVFVFHPAELTATGFYYGAIFSLLFASAAAVVYADFSARAGRLARVLAASGLLWIVAVSATNVVAIDRSWLSHSHRKTLDLLTLLPTHGKAGDWSLLEWLRPRPLAMPPPNSSRCFDSAMSIWRGWRSGGDLPVRPLTLCDVWIVSELSLARR